ncbi:MAG TPA: hypothetical protein VHV74_04690 [Pseudonocardiaceae bacterium]|nr:hypothetical protein [Pseudonocardiaceae bacterium]
MEATDDSPALLTQVAHVGTHRRLLAQVDRADAGTAPVDVIVVPIARAVTKLRTALDLGDELGATVIALCSQDATAAAARAEAAGYGADFWALDIEDCPPDVLPDFRAPAVLADAGFKHESDLDAKRNVALLLGNVVGWRSMAFLDDDIRLADVDDLRRAASLLDRYDVVGLTVTDFPDNSVVCHANRDTGGRQETFIGAGALVVRPRSVSSFFPHVYNEDWLFLLGSNRLVRAAAVGFAHQDEYDPYRDSARAVREEFGDVFAEGIFDLLDAGRGISDADEQYWAGVLDRRQGFIDKVIGRLGNVEDDGKRERMRSALLAARRMHGSITPALCSAYLEEWLFDRSTWQVALDKFRTKFGQYAEWATLSPATRLARVVRELGFCLRD